MAKRTPINISAFESDQRRTIEDLYDIIGDLTTEDLVERKVISLVSGGGGSGSSVVGLSDLNDVAATSPSDSDILVHNGTRWVNESGATARASLGLAIGADVQAWDADLDTYAANPLTSAELGQLQNIGATTISGTQWGYVGAMDQDIHTGASPTFAGLTVNSDETGILVGNTAPVRLATARDSARGSLTVQPSSGNTPGSVEIFPSGTSVRSHFIATNANDPDNFGFVEFEVNDDDAWLSADTKGTGTAPRNFRFFDFPDGIRISNDVAIGKNDIPNGTLDVAGDIISTKVNIIVGTRGTHLELSGSFTTRDWGVGMYTGNNLSIRDLVDNVDVIEFFGADDTVKIEQGLRVGDTTLTSGSVLSVGGDADVRGNLRVEGGLFAKEFTVDTTRVFLSGAFDSGGMVGEIVDGTAGSETIKFIDEDGNPVVPFEDNDLVLIQQRTGVNSGTIIKKIKRRVVADGQPSNQVSLTTSGATTGTDVDTIAVGDHAVKRGNTNNTNRDSTILIDVLDRPIGAFGFIDGRTDFGGGTEVMRVGGMDPGGANEYSSSLTGDIGIAGKIGGNLAFALTEDEGRLAGLLFNDQHITNENGQFQLSPSGLDLNAPFGVTGASSLSWFKNKDFDDQNDLVANIQGEYLSMSDQSTLQLTAMNAATTIINMVADQININGDDLVISDNLPTSDPVSAGKLFTQTATQLGGSGSEKILCVSIGGTPSAPAQPSVCKQSNALIISWAAVAGAVYYDVQYRTGGSGTWSTLQSDTSNTSVSDTAPSGNPDTTYEYRVRACNGNGCSAYSTESADTTYNTASAC